jgi:hypothetical protein
MINETIRSNGRTEDWDFVMARIIEVDTVAEAREVTRNLQDEVTRSGSKAHWDICWFGKGGKLVWTDEYVVDQAEVAIERSNDYWASMRYDPCDY